MGTKGPSKGSNSRGSWWGKVREEIAAEGNWRSALAGPVGDSLVGAGAWGVPGGCGVGASWPGLNAWTCWVRRQVAQLAQVQERREKGWHCRCWLQKCVGCWSPGTSSCKTNLGTSGCRVARLHVLRLGGQRGAPPNLLERFPALP